MNLPIHVTPNMTVLKTHGGTFIDAADQASAMSYADWNFGFNISSPSVVVNSGEVHRGTARISVAGATLTITADYQYDYLSILRDYSIATIGGPALTVPTDNDTYYYVWLHQFRFINGVVSLNRIGHVGNLEWPANFG